MRRWVSRLQKVLRKTHCLSNLCIVCETDHLGVVRPGDERRLWFVYLCESLDSLHSVDPLSNLQADPALLDR